MRLVPLALILFLAGVANAQSSVIGGTPRNIVNVPVDTSKALSTTANASRALRTPSAATNSPFNLGNIFPKISLGTWPPKTPQVSMLPQSQNVYQPNGVKGGVNPFTPAKK